jgi:hypothetical protein
VASRTIRTASSTRALAISGSIPLASRAAAMITSAAARKTAGCIEVCWPRSIASGAAPAWPLLKWIPTVQRREASKRAWASASAPCPSKDSEGSQRDTGEKAPIDDKTRTAIEDLEATAS